jgi:hypothetical protein
MINQNKKPASQITALKGNPNRAIIDNHPVKREILNEFIGKYDEKKYLCIIVLLSIILLSSITGFTISLRYVTELIKKIDNGVKGEGILLLPYLLSIIACIIIFALSIRELRKNLSKYQIINFASTCNYTNVRIEKNNIKNIYICREDYYQPGGSTIKMKIKPDFQMPKDDEKEAIKMIEIDLGRRTRYGNKFIS